MLEWVKSKVDYYRRIPEIAAGSDALEVMFKRADCLAAEVGKEGFIPDHMLHHLVRKPAQAKRLAGELVKAGLWDRVKGGYLIVDWSELNAELVRLQAKKQRDRDRKRADRAAERTGPASVDGSTDASTDMSAPAEPESARKPRTRPEDSLYESERETQKKNAAAASADLPESIEILRSALDARKMHVRWDRLTADEVAEIEQLIATHGDAALVKSALAAYQPNKPPVYAKAWLGGWRHLRAPGDLRVVADPCTGPGHTGTTARCNQCAAEKNSVSEATELRRKKGIR